MGVSMFTQIIHNACPLLLFLDIVVLASLTVIPFFAVIKDPRKLLAFASVAIKYFDVGNIFAFS